MKPIPETYFSLAMKFSGEVNTSYYAVRDGQTNAEKRTRDQLVGKLGEFAVYDLMREKYPDMAAPDCAIYSRRGKSWKEDLETPEGTISVKSQDILQEAKYTRSWVFARGDKGTPDFIAFCTVDLENREYKVWGIIKADEVIYEDMKIAWLNRTKKAVYFDTVFYQN